MKKIMVVDDDKDLLTNIKRFIKKQGGDCRVTTSCEEAMQILADFKPDLIFLDINVGNDDGRLMCRKIKSTADYEHIPIILISANHDLLILHKDHYADDYIEKPFTLANLKDIMDRYLQTI